MLAAFATALAAAALGAADVRLDLGARTEGRTTTYAPGDRSAVTLSSLELWPRATVARQDEELRLAATYDVRLRAPDLGARTKPTATQGLELRAAGRVAPRVDVTGSASGTRGETDPLRDLWTPGVDPATQPAGTVRYQAFRAQLAPTWSATRATTLGLAASAARSCGLGADRASLPCQDSTGVEASASVRSTPRDLSRAVASANRVRTAGATDAAWGTLSLEHRRDLTRQTSGRVMAGATVTSQADPGADRRWGSAPVGELGVALVPLRPVTLDLSVRTAPSVQRVEGSVRQTRTVAVTVRWAMSARWSVSGAVLDAQAWRGPSGRLSALDVQLVWAAARTLRLEVGVLSRRQVEPIARPSLYRETAGFVALVMDAPTFR